jgi:DNA polymerase I/DNA polymerase-2
MKKEFIPVDYDYFDWHGRNYAKIIGRDEKGKRICIVDSCDVYFWAILKDGLDEKKIKKLIDKINRIQLDVKGRNTKVEKTELHKKNFLGRKVKALKVFATNYKDLHDIAGNLGMPEIEKRRGYDLGFITHYIIEKKIIPLNWYEIEGEILDNSDEFGGIGKNIDVDLCMRLEKAKKLDRQEFTPKIMAFDIETDELKIGEGEILMVSLVSEKFRKVITWKDSSKISEKMDYVEYVKNEEELLEKFSEYVKKVSPDFLAGYFSDGFDLPYLRARADKLKIKLNLGLDDSQPRFFRGITPTCRINGIVHVDLLKFIQTAYSQYMQSETLSLNEVANEFLNEGKKKFEFRHSSKLKTEDWESYFEYNLQDSVLTYNLFLKFWQDIIEFARVMQEPVFEVSRNGMSKNVESFIIHNLDRFNEIPEKRPTHGEIGERRYREKYEGAFVFQPTPGLYEDICIFDFTSMHASIIVSYNLSKATLLEKKKKNCIESPEFELNGKKRKFYFSKEKSFFPELLGEIVGLRKKYKKELKEKPDAIKKARSNAFKLLANAYYGYMGFFGARYYSIESAATTLAFVRYYNKWTIEKVNQKGYNVIFGDTDSVGFTLNKKSGEETKQFLKKLNSELPGIMELDLEGFFKRGIWVTKRTGEFGAKKKYALISEDGKIKIRGFETVRRDWCRLARNVQNEVLKMILEDGNEKKAMDYVKTIIKKIKNREVDKKQLMIRTQLKKSISEYKAISPHVIAARKMQEREIPIDPGSLIEYYISETNGKKTELIREKVKLPDEKGEYNIKYYLERQILPAVENIFQVFKINTKEIVDGKKQTTLGEF